MKKMVFNPVVAKKVSTGEEIVIHAIKGDPGKTPEKGVDYLNDEDVETIANRAKELVPVYDDTELRESVSDLDEKIKDLELFKFPNVTIIGTPTINHGQINGFSSSSYLKFPFLVDFRNQPFEINMCFTTSSNVINQENIFDSDFGLAFAIRSGKFVIAISTNGTSWNLGEGVGTHNVAANTTYYVRLSWNGSVYTLAYSFDGVNYTNDISKNGTAQPYPKQIYIGVGENFSSIMNHFTGTINLNHASLKIASEVVWSGMDDAGLSTRLDLSLSNVDADGEKKIQDIAETESLQTELTKTKKDLADLEENKVGFTDYATFEKGGVVKSNYNGFSVASNGGTVCLSRTKEQYDKDNNNYFIAKGTLENVLNVERAKLTEAEKKIASLEDKNDALWKLNEGQTYDFVEKVEEGHNDTPSGGKYMTVEDVRGKTEQDTTQGYNIMPSAEKSTITEVGVTVECDGKGTYVAKGTATGFAVISFDLKDSFTIPTSLGNGGSACLYFNNEGSGLGFASIDFCNNENIVENWAISVKNRVVTTYTNQQGKQVNRINIRLDGGAGATYDVTVKPMFTNDGSSSHTFEPYTGGIPSPSPQFPQEIKSVESIEIEHYGANLFDENSPFNGWINTTEEGRVVPSNKYKTTDFIRVGSNTKAYISANTKESTYNPWRAFAFYDEDKKFVYGVSGYGKQPLEVNIPSNCTYMRATMGSESITSFDELGQTVLSFKNNVQYEPYKEPIVHTITPPRPLNKIGDYFDKADIENGVWEYKFKNEDMGNFSYGLYGSGDNVRYGSVTMQNLIKGSSDVRQKANIMCDRYASESFNDVYNHTKLNIINVNADGVLTVYTDEGLDAFKQNVKGTNVVLELLETTTEPINEENLAFLRSLESLPATDNVFITDNHGRDVSFMVQYIRKLSEV